MSVRTHSPTPILKYGRGTLLRFYKEIIDDRFKIEKEGKYDVFIEMEDKKDVKIVGMINIDDD